MSFAGTATREAIIFAADNISQFLTGVPLDLRPLNVAAWALMWHSDISPGTLYTWDENGEMHPAPGRIVDDDERLRIEQYNDLVRRLARERNALVDQFLSDSIGLPSPQYWTEIPIATNSAWQAARTPPRRDPLAIDLDGDGIETLGASPESGTPVLFDHDGDGLKTGTGWLTGDDAWLVRDLDGNGNIDSGRELFGVDTVIEAYTYWSGGGYTFGTRNAYSGFEALAVLDTGSGTFGSAGYLDGVFDARDAAFDELLLWRDLDADGTSDAGELASLSANGIVSISLQSDEVVQDLGDGNRITGSAVVTRSGGSKTDVSGVDLAASNLDLGENPFYREFPDTIPLTEAAATLPEMAGSGWLRDLHEAMSLGTAAAEELTRQVQSFAAAGTREKQLALLDCVLQAWAATSDRFKPWAVAEGMAMEPVTRELLFSDGSTETVRYVAADPGVTSPLLVHYEFRDLSMMSIGSTNGSSPADAVNVIGAEWMLRRNVLEAFNGQRFFGFEADESVGGGSGDGSGGGGGGGGSSEPNAARVRWYITIENSQRDAVNSAYEALKQSVYQALVLQTRLRPYLDAVDLVVESDSIGFDNRAMRALLIGRFGSSPVDGLQDLVELVRFATPTLEAVGFDGIAELRAQLAALSPDDPLHAAAHSLDVHQGAAMTEDATAQIWLGDDSASDVDGAGGNDILSAGGGNDRVDGGDGRDRVLGEAGHDTLRGGDDDDVLDGGAGDDYAYGGGGNDNVIGGEGVDALYGEDGHDLLDGSLGNDYLRGQGGDDVYVWGLGQGSDQIDELTSDSGTDRVEIAGVASADVVVRRNSYDDLVIRITATGETLTIVDGFHQDYGFKWVESVVWSDGSAWSLDQLSEQALVSSEAADTIYGHAGSDQVAAGGGNDVVAGNDGVDTLLGEAGDDTLRGNSGDDMLDGGAGTDYLYGGDGDDLVVGGTETDALYGEEGHDVLDGGAGNDYLRGQEGNDVYRWTAGSGSDQIDELTSDGGVDRIELTGLNPSGVSVSRSSGDDLVLSISATGESLTVIDGFDEGNASRWVESVVFASGLAWSLDDMRPMTLIGTAASDVLYGHATDDVMSGLAGSDIINGKAGHDSIAGGDGNDIVRGDAGNDMLAGGNGDDYAYGGDGDDTLQGNSGIDALYGDAGDDVLDGHAGNDYLRGHSGHDVYRWAQGGGSEQIDEQTSTDPGTDRIEITGVTSSDILVTRSSGDDLVLRIAATGETLTVVDGFSDGASFKWVESVVFGSGTVWSLPNMRLMALTGTADADLLYGHDTGDQMSGLAGNDSVNGRGGHDGINGGDGNDTLRGEDGNDTLSGGNGDDYAYGGNGNDRLQGSSGVDALYGEAGDDTLEGNAGIDYLRGHSGHDVYLWSKGSGNDQIDEQTSTESGTDRIELSGANPAGVAVSRSSSDDLILTITSSGETLTVIDGFLEAYPHKWVESVIFTNGTAWSLDQMRDMLPASTARREFGTPEHPYVFDMLAIECAGLDAPTGSAADHLGLRRHPADDTGPLLQAMASFGEAGHIATVASPTPQSTWSWTAERLAGTALQT